MIEEEPVVRGVDVGTTAAALVQLWDQFKLGGGGEEEEGQGQGQGQQHARHGSEQSV